MKSKTTKSNILLLLTSFIIELILVTIILVYEIDISLIYKKYRFINILITFISIDIISILLILDKSNNPFIDDDNKLSILKENINYKIPFIYLLNIIIKSIYIYFLINDILYLIPNRYYYIYGSIIVPYIFYIILFIIIPNNEFTNIKYYKIKLLRPLNIIISNTKLITSSLDLNTIKLNIKNNNLYLTNNEYKEILKKSKHKDYLNNNIRVITYEVDELNDEYIEDTLYKEPYNTDTKNIYHVYIYNKNNLSNKYNNYKTIKTINKNNNIVDYIENLLYKNNTSKFKYILAIIGKSIFKNNKLFYKCLDIIAEYKYKTRLYNSLDIVPKDNNIFELYRNAYLNNSAYESTITLSNYITSIGKIVEYYLYSKTDNDASKFNKDIVLDEPSIWQRVIIEYSNKLDKKDKLYNNINKNYYKLSTIDKLYIEKYLGYMTDTNIQGDRITYEGLKTIYQLFRNKIQAHGTITDNNTYVVWYIMNLFARLHSEVFMVNKLEINYMDNNEVEVNYMFDDNKYNLGIYVIHKDNSLLIYYPHNKEKGSLVYKNTYVDYINTTINEK